MRTTVFGLLAAITALSAAASFALTAWGAYGFGAHVWQLPRPLALLLPIAVDLCTIGTICAAYALRTAPWWTRGYVWLVMGFCVGASVATNEAYVMHLDLGDAARVAALFPPLFLALQVHLLIIVRRWVDTKPVALEPRGEERRPARTSEVRVAGGPSSRGGPPPRASVAAAVSRRIGRPPHPQAPAAVAAVLAGQSTAEVAQQLGLSRRSLQDWVRKARDNNNGHVPAPTGTGDG